jgi:hypothetical protein
VSTQAQIGVPWGTILLINGLGVAAVAYFGGYTFPERLLLGIFAAGLVVYGMLHLVRGIMAKRMNAGETVPDGQPSGTPDKSANAQ